MLHKYLIGVAYVICFYISGTESSVLREKYLHTEEREEK